MNPKTFNNMNTYRMSSTPNTFDFNGLEGYYTSPGIYGVWFQYAFSTAITATSNITILREKTK
jgi:hypothetical protein